ncbi:Chromatin modification-related protein EAF1 [Meyerozyma sp. JA9]|nr:Chromatin modification-related protein EAF1 [Meyerozyma sp. JA9]
MSDQDFLVSKWKNKVAELLQLTSDPLLTTFIDTESQFSSFFNSISIQDDLDLDSLPTTAAHNGDLEAAVRSSFTRVHKIPRQTSKEDAEDNQPETQRESREIVETETSTTDKVQGRSSPQVESNRDTPPNPKPEPIALSEPHKRRFSEIDENSQRSQIPDEDVYVKKEASDVVVPHAKPPNESLADLDIIIAPEHYPTHPHAVSSLSELYYLTQTLPLIKLLPGSHKALFTENFESALLEGKIAVLYSRIEELKRQGKWSLRQPRKYDDPFKKNVRPHWDTLVMEGKWMATDFREGTKFKKAACVMIAQAINDYWTYGKEVCIRPAPIRHLDEDVEMSEAVSESEPAVPEKKPLQEVVEQSPLPPTGGKDATSLPSEAINQEVKEESVPVSVPGNEPEQDSATGIVLDETPANTETGETNTEPATLDPQALNGGTSEPAVVEEPQGPLFIPQKHGDAISSGYPFRLNMDFSEVPRLEQSIFTHLPKFNGFDNDEIQHPKPPLTTRDSPMVPISRLIHPFEEDNMWYKLVVKESTKRTKNTGTPEYQRGLFSINAHRRFNYLKPPKPPLIKNIEYRSPTIWLPEDDKHLIHYVAEFCFNWEVISEHLSSPSATLKRYESNIERRTPWQCFERYIQLNEKFQFSDMKGMYAHHAQKWLEHAHGAQSTTKRRISPLGVGNESIQRGHRRLRWASMFDAMRKSMRKREIALAKLNKKRNEVNSATPTATPTGTPTQKRPADRIPTPLELSKLKFERDKSIHEAYVNQQATRSRMIAAVAQQKRQGGATNAGELDPQAPPQGQLGPRQGQLGQANPLPQGQIRQPPPGANAMQSQMSSQPPGQRPQVPAQQRGMPMKRPTSPNGTPYTTEQIQQMLLKRRQNQAGQLGQGMNPGNPGATQQLNQMSQALNSGNSPQMNRSVNLAGQAPSSSPPMVPGTQAKSPQMGQVASPNLRYNQVQPSNNNSKSRIHFAPAQVSAIINSIQNKNPNLTKEQVTKLAATYLANIQQQQQSRINQQQQPQPQQPQAQQPPQPQVRKQPQVANLTPQERSQLQMLKNRKPSPGQPELPESKSGEE